MEVDTVWSKTVVSVVKEVFITVINSLHCSYEGVSRSFRTGLLELELQMVQLSATRCSCILFYESFLVSFAAITLCVASHRVFIVVVYFVIDSVRKLLDTPSYVGWFPCVRYSLGLTAAVFRSLFGSSCDSHLGIHQTRRV
jgi:hypothetical protein